MPHAPRSPSTCAKMQTKLSAWTPLNHPVANSKVFEERRILLAKWFDRWSDRQRRAVLQDCVLSCSEEQLRFLSVSVSGRLPLQAADFTCLLPRALCLYLFSFLDPRSLCRCAQVSWHWKSIVELDQLWIPKCLKHGWSISFSPTRFEQGVWKRHYIQTVQELRLSPQRTASSQQQFLIPDVTRINGRHEDLPEPGLLTGERPGSAIQRVGSSFKTGLSRERKPPWRDSDRHPKDTQRFNYLDNLDPMEQALTVRMRGASSCSSTSLKPDGESKKKLSEANYKLRKAKSLMSLSSNHRSHPLHRQSMARPQWASHSEDHPPNEEAADGLLRLARWNAGICPGPVRVAVPQLSAEAFRASQRSHRSSPSHPYSKQS
ncbi:F-box only protein 16 [Echeneis naucrates]|uniref:F-box only protein 16 n=1 Tax=Echeneis naucrates TaxID=173247 RepID=UPI0011138B8A|nr:F-box only protein 16 [Echeneis naucrates]